MFMMTFERQPQEAQPQPAPLPSPPQAARTFTLSRQVSHCEMSNEIDLFELRFSCKMCFDSICVVALSSQGTVDG